MKKLTVTVLAATAFALNACAPHNDTKTGSTDGVGVMETSAIPVDATGATVILCRDPRTGHAKADLFDLYEAAHVNHMHVDRDHPSDAHAAFVKFARKWALREMDSRQDESFLETQRHGVDLDYKKIRSRADMKMFRNKFGLPTQQLESLDQSFAFEDAFLASAKFTDDRRYFMSDDNTQVAAPGCKLLQLINHAPDGTTYVRKPLWDKLDPLDQGAAVAHEYLMSKYRGLGAKSSIETRAVVAEIFSDHLAKSLVSDFYDRLDCISGFGKRKLNMTIQFPKDRQSPPLVTMTRYWNQLLVEPVSSPWTSGNDLFLGASGSIAACKLHEQDRAFSGFVQSGTGPVLKFQTSYFQDEFTSAYTVRCGQANVFDKTTDFEMDLDLYNARTQMRSHFTCRGMENLGVDVVRRALR